MIDEKKLFKDLDELNKYRQLGTVEELAKRIPEEKVLKFYYCESLDKYLVGFRCGTMYYAELTENHDLCMIMSRYLPWGKHIVDETTLWKEHTYPSEPKEISFDEWLKGYIKKQPKISLETKTSDWIPCSERLPEVWKSVLVTSGHLRVRDIRIAFVNENMEWCSIWNSCEPDILAWMPLPEPYKGNDYAFN